MQSIEPATALMAYAGLIAAEPVPTPRVSEPAATVTKATTPTADVAIFGRDTFAVFSVDEETKSTRIAIYDGEGRLMRMIPADSVADMLSQLAAYRRLR
jgi:hypothetical protein